MSDQLLPGATRRRIQIVQQQQQQQDTSRAALLSALTLLVSVVLSGVGVGILVGCQTSPMAGFGAAMATTGVLLFILGVLLGLNT
jgi:uncharacterized membrane protein YqjE